MKWQAIQIAIDLLRDDEMLDHDGGDEYSSTYVAAMSYITAVVTQ